MSQEKFEELVTSVAESIAGKPLGAELQAELEASFPAAGETFESLAALCREGVSEGWLCNREQGGIKFGVVFKDIDGFSVDVVQMNTVVGPHHRHPRGEIDMIMPISPGAKFDGHGGGWVVYGPESAHNPTVTDGDAVVLYLLPGGEIEFTR